MKKFKSLVFVLACALFFVGAMGITKASAEGEAPTMQKPTINFDEETITVGANAQVYYQVVKSNSASGLKPANWIKAAKDNATYYIDFSATSNTKNAYFALTLDPTATSGEVVEVAAKIKSIKPILNYAMESITSKGLDDIFKGIEIKGIDSKYNTTKGNEADPTKYTLIWKRGANGDWGAENTFQQVHWDMLKASNGTLYVSLVGDAADADDYEYDFRASKEAKVKIPKSAKAPTVKIDYAKGTIALKNGMQVSQNETNWLTVAAYDKAATAAEVYVTNSATKTKTKVSSVAVGDLIAAINDNLETDYVAKSLVELFVRTAATDKKFPSAVATFKFTAPADKLTAKGGDAVEVPYTVADKTAKIAAEMVIDLADFITETEYAKYEYLLLDTTIDASKVNLAKVKWTKAPTDGKIDLSSKVGKTYKYTQVDGTSITKKYEESANLVIRVMADKENELFASEPLEVAFTTKAVKYVPIEVSAGSEVTYTVEIGEDGAKKAKNGDVVKVTYKIADTHTFNDITTDKPQTDATKSTGVYSFKAVVGEDTTKIEVTIKTDRKPNEEEQGE